MSNGGLEVTTTSLCKNMCSYCPQQVLRKSYGPMEYMTLKTFEKCLSKVPLNIDILFAGFAEPFLNPQCSAMIKIACKKGYLVNLYTTLVGLRSTDIDDLIGLKINNVCLHLPDNDGDMKCKVDDSYIFLLKEFVSKIGYTNAHSYNSLHYKLNNILNVNVSTKMVLHTRSNNVSDMKPNDRKTGNIICDVIRRHNRKNYNHNVLLPNGDVVLCCMDYSLKHKFGNLLKDNYEDLFKSENYMQFISGLNDDTKDILCRTCSESKNL